MNRMFFKRKLCQALCTVLIFWISACSKQASAPVTEVLRISVQPGISNSNQLQHSYLILMRYLEQELDVKVEWVVTRDYQDQLDRFHNEELDLALLGGLAFVKAYKDDEAEPLVMRDVDFHFASYFIVAKNNKASKISDLQGQSFSFGSKFSTSGHLMPRFFLSTQDIIPENFFSQVLFSGAHDKTAQWVEEGKVDIGVVNSVIIDRMFVENKLNRNKVKILWKTPTYPDYVWTARKKLPETLKAKIIEAFIKMSSDNKQHAQLLEQLGAKYYFPANSDDFEPIRKIAVQFNMLNANE